MPESLTLDSNYLATKVFDLASVQTEAWPPWTLGSGIHAGMTGFSRWLKYLANQIF
jgi:hypothetical protein